MTFDLQKETPLTFKMAKGYCEKRYGKRPDQSTFWRWFAKGLRGIRLQTVLTGAVRITTEEALDRFFEAVNKAADRDLGIPPEPIAPVVRDRQIEASARRLHTSKPARTATARAAR